LLKLKKEILTLHSNLLELTFLRDQWKIWSLINHHHWQ